MKVMKFGGTSVGSVKSILSVRQIVEKAARRESVIVVVSALGGVTDQLLRTARMARDGDEEWKVSYQQMVQRHHSMIDTIFSDPIDKVELWPSLLEGVGEGMARCEGEGELVGIHGVHLAVVDHNTDVACIAARQRAMFHAVHYAF